MTVALPEALSYHTLKEGHDNPDWHPLNEALNEFRDGPIVDDMHRLGHGLQALSEAAPKAGLQGTFLHMYGNLTLVLADATEGNHPSKLPDLDSPDDLKVQAGNFAFTYTNPLDLLTTSKIANEQGDFELEATCLKKLYEQYPHYFYSFEDSRMQLSHPVVQFKTGMDFHILAADLGESLDRSKVSEQYMARGGDFDKVNFYIRYVAHKNAPALMGGNKLVQRTAIEPVAVGIAAMRHLGARPLYRKLQRAESAEEYEDIRHKANMRALRIVKASVSVGRVAMPTYSKMVGAEAWPPQELAAAA